MPEYPTDQYGKFDEDDPAFQVRILAIRVETLTKEKEKLEHDLNDERKERVELDRRVAIIEKTFQRGAGVALALPFIGAAVGLILAYGKVIFAPWMANK
jgi:hypothetical protein